MAHDRASIDLRAVATVVIDPPTLLGAAPKRTVQSADGGSWKGDVALVSSSNRGAA